MVFGMQVGRQNGPKIDPKKHGKKHAKKDQFFNALGGGVPRARHLGGWIVRPPKSRFFKTDQTPLELGKGKGNGLGQGEAHGPGLGCLVLNPYSRRRAKHGCGYIINTITIANNVVHDFQMKYTDNL